MIFVFLCLIYFTQYDTYTLLYMKEVTNKGLLYSAGKSTQYTIIASMGKESKKSGYRYMYNWFTLLYT